MNLRKEIEEIVEEARREDWPNEVLVDLIMEEFFKHS